MSAENNSDTGKTPETKPGKTTDPKMPKSAARTVKEGKTEREIKLEKELAFLQDEKATLKTRNSEMETIIANASKTPAPGNPGKSLLDYLADFWAGR